jgi:putative protease
MHGWSGLKLKPEVMSPAGYWPQLRAAIDAGADSVYFGLKHFTARAKVGFQLEELPEIMRTLHGRGVKGYVTFNTLIFEHELKEAARSIAAIAEAGADALIIQDVGVAELAHQIAPQIEIHASTQMSITSAEGARLAQRFGVSRVTLARELSLQEIRAIRAETDCELEIFVHGALCVAYSGQCFSSEAWGGRSANRGQCAQACRLPYEMIVDGELRPLGDVRYLLSPGDLYALHQVPEIAKIGISALKIEGRYKDADYVALVTRAYRKAVDELPVTPQEELQLQQVYSRGLGPYFISGTNHQAVVQGRAPRHRGVCMGRVTRVLADRVLIEPDGTHNIAPLKAGDGLVFDAADWRSPQEQEEGGRLYQVVSVSPRTLELHFANGAVNFKRIRTGDLVWRTHDPDLDKAISQLPVRKQQVRVQVKAHEGQPLKTDWILSKIRITVNSTEPLGKAQTHALNVDRLRDQFSRLGNTPYELTGIEFDLAGSPFAPVSLLNQIRRQAVEALMSAQAASKAVVIHPPEWPLFKPVEPRETEPISLHLLVRTKEQLDAAIELRPASITLDFLDLYGLKPSVERVKESGIPVRVAAPRILKPGEERIVDFLQRLACPILVRSTGLLELLKNRAELELTGDFSLNAANSLTAATFLKLGLHRVTPTHDLNAEQVSDLAQRVGGAVIEAIAYQHLPVFHTEHCVFCRFLSTGTSYKDCGRPCEKHRVEVRDTSGRSHPVIADIGCRNTVFGAEAQEASAHVESWLRAGIRHFRLEFAHESEAQVALITGAFEDALSGRITFAQLATRLKRMAPQGTTEGSLFVPSNYLTLPVLQ